MFAMPDFRDFGPPKKKLRRSYGRGELERRGAFAGRERAGTL
jgi:hypothetical protein